MKAVSSRQAGRQTSTRNKQSIHRSLSACRRPGSRWTGHTKNINIKQYHQSHIPSSDEVWKTADGKTTLVDGPIILNWPKGSLKHAHAINQMNIEVCKNATLCYERNKPDLDIFPYALHKEQLWRTDCFSDFSLDAIHNDFIRKRSQYDLVPTEYILPVGKMKYGTQQIEVNVTNQVERYAEFRYSYIGNNAKWNGKTGLYEAELLEYGELH